MSTATKGPLQTHLLSVTIVYCRNGVRWEKEVDLNKVGGLWWEHAGAGNTGVNYVPGTKRKLDEPCPPGRRLGGGESACWWDNQHNQWVCPDGLG